MNSGSSAALLFAIIAAAAETMLAADTLLAEQFCQHYYTLDGDCPALRSAVRPEVRGSGTPTLELGNKDTQPAMVFLHGWPDTSAIWANQFAEFCGGSGGYFCVAPSWIGFHPDFPPAKESELLWSNQVDAFHAVVEDLGLRNITFVIFDFGALIGYQFLYRFPHLINKVVALDTGLTVGPASAPFDGLIDILAAYQQGNIKAFLADDDDAMMANLDEHLGSRPPCHDCRIAPSATIGIGAKTGWPYYNIVRMDEPWSGFFDVPLESWEFTHVPSFPANIPLLFLYSSTKFHDKSFRDWIDGRGDGVSEHLHMNGTDHWLQVRIPTATNAKIAEWIGAAGGAPPPPTSTPAAPPPPTSTPAVRIPEAAFPGQF